MQVTEILKLMVLKSIKKKFSPKFGKGESMENNLLRSFTLRLLFDDRVSPGEWKTYRISPKTGKWCSAQEFPENNFIFWLFHGPNKEIENEYFIMTSKEFINPESDSFQFLYDLQNENFPLIENSFHMAKLKLSFNHKYREYKCYFEQPVTLEWIHIADLQCCEVNDYVFLEPNEEEDNIRYIAVIKSL